MAAPRANPRTSKTIGAPDQQSRAKAEKAHERAKEQLTTVDSDSWPRGSDGKPMMKVLMTASELVPTGQYANVSIGPAQITAFVDASRDLETEQQYFSDQERATIAQALNELAEIVEGDVVAVQRNLVMENLQENVSDKS